MRGVASREDLKGCLTLGHRVKTKRNDNTINPEQAKHLQKKTLKG